MIGQALPQLGLVLFEFAHPAPAHLRQSEPFDHRASRPAGAKAGAPLPFLAARMHVRQVRVQRMALALGLLPGTLISRRRSSARNRRSADYVRGPVEIDQAIPHRQGCRHQSPPLVADEERQHSHRAVRAAAQRNPPERPDARNLVGNPVQHDRCQRLSGRERAQRGRQRADLRVLEGEQRDSRLPGLAAGKDHPLLGAPVQPPKPVANLVGLGLRALVLLGTQIRERHAFRPVRDAVMGDLPSDARVRFRRTSEDAQAFSRRGRLGAYALGQLVRPSFGRFRLQHRVHIQLVKIEPALFRIQDIRQLVHAELRQDASELVLQDLAHAQLNGVLQREVQGAHDMVLPDPVHPADALLELHWIPGQVVIDDHVAELEIESLPAGIGRDQHLGLGRERPLHLAALVHIERAVELRDREAPVGKEFGQHGLGRDELGEDQDLEFVIVLLLLERPNLVQESLRLRIGTLGFATPGGRTQRFHLGPFLAEPFDPPAEPFLQLFLGIEIRPSLADVLAEQAGLVRGQIEHFKPPFQRGADGAHARRHQTLHQDHQEPDGGVLLETRLVVALANVFRDGIVERSLIAVGSGPSHGHNLSPARLEQRRALGIDRVPLFGADDEGSDALPPYRVFVGERFAVQQPQETAEIVGLALMRRRREQEHARGRLG